MYVPVVMVYAVYVYINSLVYSDDLMQWLQGLSVLLANNGSIEPCYFIGKFTKKRSSMLPPSQYKQKSTNGIESTNA